ncbi:hypothetical protein, partial [Pseudomonas gingeri]|uniref:hypothetical protein n=1 Tax=Pseudomonas gingeri TaxID=117681 RepID=UPI001C4B3949
RRPDKPTAKAIGTNLALLAHHNANVAPAWCNCSDHAPRKNHLSAGSDSDAGSSWPRRCDESWPAMARNGNTGRGLMAPKLTGHTGHSAHPLQKPLQHLHLPTKKNVENLEIAP